MTDLERCAAEQQVCGEYIRNGGPDQRGAQSGAADWLAEEARMDINPSDTLQRESAREDNDERHICPLQLEVIERGIELWTNPGNVVLSPFGGIGSEGYVAVKNGRKAVIIELKESYYKQAVLNLAAAAQEAGQETLFSSAV